MINSDWKLLKVRDFAEVIGGGTPSTKNVEYWGNDIPWISPKDLSNYSFKYISKGQKSITKLGLSNSSAKLLPSNSLLFSSRAPIGYLAINTCPVATNQGFKSLIPKKGFDIEYIYYLFKKNIEYIKSQSTGSTFQEVSGSFVKNLEFFIPSYKEQLQISRVLSTLDKKIEINQKMNKNLEEIAETFFKSWFVNFDPVIAKAEGRLTGLSKKISELFPDTFENSEFGKIPKGWKASFFSDVLSIQGGFAFKSKNFGNKGSSVIKIRNIKNDGTVDTDNCDKLSKIPEECERFLLNDGDIIIAMTGATVGKVGQISVDDNKYYLNQRVGRLKPIIANNKCAYSHLLLNSKRSRDFVESFAYGSAQPNISSSDIESIPNITPSKNLILKFNEIISPNLEKILLNFKENKRLLKIQKMLLKKLISGKLRISDAEKLIDEVRA